MNELKSAERKATSATRNQASAPASRKPPAAPNPATAGGAGLDFVIKIALIIAVIAAVFFFYRTTTLQSDMTKAQEESAKLRSDMDKVQMDLGKAETKANQATEQMTKLQTQANQAKAELASAKANADKAASDAAELQTRLNQANRQAAEAKANADKASAQVAKLQAQLQAQAQAQAQTQAQTQPPVVAPEPVKPVEQPAPAQPAATNLKPLPLTAGFKKAMMLDRTALAIQNTSSSSLSLTVRFSNATGSKETHVTLEPGAVQELGWLGDWVLASGDKVEIESPGCEPIVKTVP